MTDDKIGQMSVLSLAHIGDGVYELLTRCYLAERGATAVETLHRQTVERVNAPAQARAMERLLPLLSDEERAVYKRGRNARVNSVPKAAELSEYHAATGLEALFGWLWLKDRRARIDELFAAAMEE